MPSIYACIVLGVNYKSKWYVSRQNVTYFDAADLDEGKKVFFDNLQKWDFFKDNSVEFNSDFWETNLFAKVPDLTKDPKWDKYKDSMWKSDEVRNRPYIGMYKIVADHLRKSAGEEADNFESTYGEQVMRPFFDKLKSGGAEEVKEYILMNKKFTLIFPSDRAIVLAPIVLETKRSKQLRYFVSFPGKPEIYEWTYLKPLEPKYNHYGGDVVDQLESITTWNFSMTTLDDQSFWDTYVTKKENGNFVYLRKMN
jgi:hypothetical protein